MKYLSPALVEQTINNTRGTVFSVTYDNYDGSSRTISARTGVGAVRNDWGGDNQLMIIFDMTNRKYTYINKTRVREIKANRKTLTVSTPL